MRVQLSELVLGARERARVDAALDARQISSHGAFLEEFETRCAAVTGRAHAVSCTNGTAALELALRACDIGAGDEVICPTFTFSGTAAAIIHVGATPTLVDADVATWCISAEACRDAFTPRTKAIIAVDVFGVPCDFAALESLCAENKLALIEDTAEAVGALYGGRPCGSFGTVSTLSFFENKIVAAGEGGVCVTNDDEISRRIAQLKNHGGRPGAHGVFDIPGYNYRMTNLHAAIACAQFEQLNDFAARRRATDAQYRVLLADIPQITFQKIPPEATSSYWMTGVVYDGDVAALVAALAADEIETRPFFTPIHEQPYAADWFVTSGFPVAHRLHTQGICLPNGNTTTSEQVAYVCERLRQYIATNHAA